jgi:hypothetical protein
LTNTEDRITRAKEITERVHKAFGLDVTVGRLLTLYQTLIAG